VRGPLKRHLDALPSAWRSALGEVLAGATVRALAAFLDARLEAGATIYPPEPLAALHDLAPQRVRAVILGQDPYHGPGQAHGYAFSVPRGLRLPPSLRNIFAERARDCGCASIGASDAIAARDAIDAGDMPTAPGAGDLRSWSAQGVLLLNTVLTVEQGAPGSHASKGWETITDAVIDAVAALPGPRVFMLWGAHAQAKGVRIEQAASADARHLVLTANHPSPLSARRPPVPFIGCGHFSRANRFLMENGEAPIDWCR
jgi:uracil-DNA glycosylase